MAHYFIAIPLPKNLREFYLTWQTELRDKLHFKKWPHPDDFHITLKFLGEADHNSVKILDKKLKSIAFMKDSFTLQLGTISFFGVIDRPRVLFADVLTSTSLIKFQKEVEDVSVQAGFSREKRTYRPHMTLAKKWSNGPIKENMIRKFQEDFNVRIQFDVSSFTLYHIHPRQVPSYETVGVYLFGER